jgi:hypothetical protein
MKKPSSLQTTPNVGSCDSGQAIWIIMPAWHKSGGVAPIWRQHLNNLKNDEEHLIAREWLGASNEVYEESLSTIFWNRSGSSSYRLRC